MNMVLSTVIPFVWKNLDKDCSLISSVLDEVRNHDIFAKFDRLRQGHGAKSVKQDTDPYRSRNPLLTLPPRFRPMTAAAG